MISLTKSPALVSLAGNPIVFNLNTDNFIETSGIKSKLTITFTAAPVADDYFTLEFLNRTIVFTAKLSPDNSGIQFRINDGNLSLVNYLIQTVGYLENNYWLYKNYNITSNATQIIIEAKEFGADYSFTTVSYSAGFPASTNSNISGVTEIIRSFFKIAVLVYANDVFISELELAVDENGDTVLNLEDFLKHELSSDFLFPESDTTFIYDRSSQITKFYIKYGEKFDDDYQALTQSSDFYALLGGLSFMQQAKYNTEATSYWAKLVYNTWFLTWQPVIKHISAKQSEKIYYLNHSAASTLKLKVKYYIAGSPTTIEPGTIASTQYNVYEFVLSPEKLAIPGLSAQTLEKYEVWIENQSNTRVSEIRTFILDYRTEMFDRYFLFRNSIGGWDSIRTIGKLTGSDEYERISDSHILDFDFTSKDREDLSLKNEERQTFEANTGWLNRFSDDANQYRNYLRDFLLSKEVFQIINNTLIPVNIIDKNVFRDKDNEQMYNLKFRYVRAFTDEYYTKEIVKNYFDESYSSDFELAQ